MLTEWTYRRVKFLQEVPYTDKEADAAAGMGTASFLEARRAAMESEKLGAKEMEVDGDIR